MTEADKERLAKLMELNLSLLEEVPVESRGHATKGWLDGMIEAYGRAAFLIREQPTDDPWLSVEDRLPEDDCYVLAIGVFGDLFVACCENTIMRSWQNNGGYPVHPTHWMAIPSPPRGSA